LANLCLAPERGRLDNVGQVLAVARCCSSRRFSMHSLSRRTLLKATGLLLASTALPASVFAQATPTGGRLTVAADSEPRSLNPAIVASNGVFFVASKVIEPLAEASFDGADGLSPRLATSWEGSDDGLSVTFKLREGVTWHDGT